MKLWLCVCATKEKAKDERYAWVGNPYVVQAKDEGEAKVSASLKAVHMAWITEEHLEQGLAVVRVLSF